MLTLSRHEGESVVIGAGADQVVITVVAIRGDKARLGVVAPDDVPVHRREVYDLILRRDGHVGSNARPRDGGPVP